VEYQIGQSYTVTCTEIRLKEDGRAYAIPVFAQPHTDAQFNFPHEHYHIDGRFAMRPRMRHRLQMVNGYTRSIILPSGSEMYDFIGLTALELVCERQQSGLSFAGHNADLSAYEKWYQGYLGQSCKGRRCPHLGTDMLEYDGKLVCPMHHLTADPVTHQIIERI